MATPGDGRIGSKRAGGEKATAACDTGTFKRSAGGAAVEAAAAAQLSVGGARRRAMIGSVEVEEEFSLQVLHPEERWDTVWMRKVSEVLLLSESRARVSSHMEESRAREQLDEKRWERVLLLLRGEKEDSAAGVGPAVEAFLRKLLHAPVPWGVSKTEYYKHRQHRLNALCSTPHATRLLREFVGQFDGCLEW
eukprot:Hpha_TRINITY_DN16430_c2_g1::TRINITY_DN16430_c2_g1_i7::g.158849::m.158849